MKASRKNITVTLPSEAFDLFAKAKEHSENELMMKLSDAQFATRMLIWALGAKNKEMRA